MPKRAVPIVKTWAKATSDFMIYQMGRFALVSWVLLVSAVVVGFLALENDYRHARDARYSLCRDEHTQVVVMRQILTLATRPRKGETDAQEQAAADFLAQADALLKKADCQPAKVR